jgi:hypothetical protein
MRISALIITHVHVQSQAHLTQVVFAGRGAHLSLGHREHREKQRGENTDDGNDRQEFDQRETPGME